MNTRKIIRELVSGCSEIELIDHSESTGCITYTTDTCKEITYSSETEIPEGFPTDIPMPKEIGVTSSIRSNDSITVTIETEMPFDKVVEIYWGYLEKAGYIETYKMNEYDFFNYSGKRDSEQLVVTLQLDLEDNKTVTGILVYESFNQSNNPEE